MDQPVTNGLLFIPDISGFTEFVSTTDTMTGQRITCELLSAIIAQNNLQLKIAEIEGDAILFYRYGAAPAVSQLQQQFRTMATAFEQKRMELEQESGRPLRLALKIIAHYGPMTEFRIGPFQKLYGEVVIEAHRLLKNTISSNSYLLLTDSLLHAAGSSAEATHHSSRICEVYGSLRNICFTYYDLYPEQQVA